MTSIRRDTSGNGRPGTFSQAVYGARSTRRSRFYRDALLGDRSSRRFAICRASTDQRFHAAMVVRVNGPALSLGQNLVWEGPPRPK